MEDAYLNERLAFPATIRNRDSIANVLSNYIPRKGLLLEIACGSEEHVVFFKSLSPQLFGKPVIQKKYIEKVLVLGFLIMTFPRRCLSH